MAKLESSVGDITDCVRDLPLARIKDVRKDLLNIVFSHGIGLCFFDHGAGPDVTIRLNTPRQSNPGIRMFVKKMSGLNLVGSHKSDRGQLVRASPKFNKINVAQKKFYGPAAAPNSLPAPTEPKTSVSSPCNKSSISLIDFHERKDKSDQAREALMRIRELGMARRIRLRGPMKRRGCGQASYSEGSCGEQKRSPSGPKECHTGRKSSTFFSLYSRSGGSTESSSTERSTPKESSVERCQFKASACGKSKFGSKEETKVPDGKPSAGMPRRTKEAARRQVVDKKMFNTGGRYQSDFERSMESLAFGHIMK